MLQDWELEQAALLDDFFRELDPQPIRTVKRSEVYRCEDGALVVGKKPLRVDFNNLPPLLTVPQTAAFLQKSEKAVRRMIEKAKLPVSRNGRSVLIRRDALFKQYRIKIGA